MKFIRKKVIEGLDDSKIEDTLKVGETEAHVAAVKSLQKLDKHKEDVTKEVTNSTEKALSKDVETQQKLSEDLETQFGEHKDLYNMVKASLDKFGDFVRKLYYGSDEDEFVPFTEEEAEECGIPFDFNSWSFDDFINFMLYEGDCAFKEEILDFVITRRVSDEEYALLTKKSVLNSILKEMFSIAKKALKNASLNEDTKKLANGKWANVGKDGKVDSGTFRTKKEADAQRRAMFAESKELEESILNEINRCAELYCEDETKKQEFIDVMTNGLTDVWAPIAPIFYYGDEECEPFFKGTAKEVKFDFNWHNWDLDSFIKFMETEYSDEVDDYIKLFDNDTGKALEVLKPIMDEHEEFIQILYSLLWEVFKETTMKFEALYNVTPEMLPDNLEDFTSHEDNYYKHFEKTDEVEIEENCMNIKEETNKKILNKTMNKPLNMNEIMEKLNSLTEAVEGLKVKMAEKNVVTEAFKGPRITSNIAKYLIKNGMTSQDLAHATATQIASKFHDILEKGLNDKAFKDEDVVFAQKLVDIASKEMNNPIKIYNLLSTIATALSNIKVIPAGKAKAAVEKPEPELKEGKTMVVKRAPVKGRVKMDVPPTDESLNKPMVEDLKIIADLDDYKPWSGAVHTWEIIEENDKIGQLEAVLEDIYPDGLTKTELNDLLWFDSDYVLDLLNIKEDEDEEEDDDDVVEEEALIESKDECSALREASGIREYPNGMR